MKTFLKLLGVFMFASAFAPLAMADETTRNERNFITDGNKLYREERFADAEVLYKKALEINPNNETALFNLAASYLRQGTASGENLKEAEKILNSLIQNPKSETIAELAYFNLGNIAYNGQDYAKAISHYKNSLRRNPANDKARENLRLAQKKQQEQQNQNQDQQQQDQQQNQDQQQQQDKQQQQQNQQNQEQNQEQNKDQQQQQQQQQQQPQQQPQQQGGISRDNAEKILKTMENEENATRQRVNAERRKGGAPNRRPVTKPW